MTTYTANLTKVEPSPDKDRNSLWSGEILKDGQPFKTYGKIPGNDQEGFAQYLQNEITIFQNLDAAAELAVTLQAGPIALVTE